MITNRHFHERTRFFENKAKAEASELEWFIYFLLKDESFWRRYENDQRKRFGLSFVPPNRTKLACQYVIGAHYKDGRPAFCDESRTKAEQILAGQFRTHFIHL